MKGKDLIRCPVCQYEAHKTNIGKAVADHAARVAALEQRLADAYEAIRQWSLRAVELNKLVARLEGLVEDAIDTLPDDCRGKVHEWREHARAALAAMRGEKGEG